MLTGVREAAGTCLGSLQSGGRAGPHPCAALLWSCKQARPIPVASSSSSSASTSGSLENGSRALDRANGAHARNSLAGRGASARRAATASALERSAAEEEALAPSARPGRQGLGHLVDASTESTPVLSARRRSVGTPLVRASPTRDLPEATAADRKSQQGLASRASPRGTAVDGGYEADRANPGEGGQNPLRRKRKPASQAPPSGAAAAAAASGPRATQADAQVESGDVGPGWLHSVLSGGAGGSGGGGGDGGRSSGGGIQSGDAPVRRRYSAPSAPSDRDGVGSGLRASRGSESGSTSSSNASMDAGGSGRRRGTEGQQTEERHWQGEQEEGPGGSARRRPAPQQADQPRWRRTVEQQQQEQQPPASRAPQGQRRLGPGLGAQAGRGDGSRRATAGGRGAAAGGAGEQGAGDNGAWGRIYVPVDFAATCANFAALDRFLDQRGAQGQGQGQGQALHPVVMSGAFNHVVQLAQQAGGNLKPEDLRVVYKLQAMFQPHTATCNNSRYLVNALWVCARVGAWGDGSFAAAMVDRLRQNNYALVNSAVGQAHGNLWWSLSQWAQHQQAQGQAGAQGPPDVAQACWDVLEASAGAIKRAPYLDQSSFKPQELANILLGAARLGYDHDHQLIHVLLSAFVRHPGPFKPQAVSNALYALGELLGSHDAQVSAGSGAAGPGGPGGPLHQQQNPHHLHRLRDAGVAAAHSPRATVQQEPWLSHVCGLAVLAVGELGLSSFKPQELSNLLIGCARLEVQLPVTTSWALAPGAGGLGPGAATQGNSARASSTSVRDSGAAQLQSAVLTPRRRGQRPRGGGSPSGSPRGSRDSLDEEDGGDVAQRSGGEGEGEEGGVFLGRYDGPGGWGAGDDEGWEGAGAAGGGGAVPTRQSPPSPDTVKWFVEELAAHVRTRIMADAPHASRAGWVSQALGNASWALARMGYMEQSYYAAVVHATCLGAMRTAKPQEWSNLFWALATVKHQPPRDLVTLLYETVRDTSWAAAEQAWCNVLWALAVLDMYDGRLVGWIAHGAAQVGARRLTVTSLTNSLWALASMPDGAMAAQAPLVNMLVEEVNRRGDIEMDLGGRVQLWQAQLEIDAAIKSGAAVALEPPSPPATSSAKAGPKRASRSRLPLSSTSAPGPRPAAAASSTSSSSLPALMRLSPSIARYAREGLLTANADLPDRRMTSLQLDVYGCAVFLMVEARTRSGAAAGTAAAPAAAVPGSGSGADGDGAGAHIVRVEQEWLVEQLGMRVDMCLWLSDGREVVVEVDGPSHYMSSDPRVKVPRAKLRDRQLERVYGKGNVVSVPYWQWDYLGRQDTKRAYMQRTLRLA